MDGIAWWATVHGVAKSRARLSDFTFTFHFHALEKEMATHSSVLTWRIPGTEEPGGLPSLGSHRVGHDWSDLAVTAAALFPEWLGTSYFISLSLLLCKIGNVLDSFVGKGLLEIGKCFPGGTSGKGPTCQCRRCRRHGFNPWVRKIPQRRAWPPTLVFLPGESHGQRSLAGYSPEGHKESDTTEAT